MSVKDQLTNEKVSKRFDNPFALVNYAIKLAKQRIAQGDIGEFNLSNEIINAIDDGRDYLEDFEEEDEVIEYEEIATKSIVVEELAEST